MDSQADDEEQTATLMVTMVALKRALSLMR